MLKKDPVKPIYPNRASESAVLGAAMHSGSSSPESERPRVLVVEDNRLNSELVRIFLKDLCHMEFARTGEEAVEIARLGRFDAIVMDINLGPGMNGIQAAQVIRTFNGFENIPIIAVTGYAMESDKDQILEAGCSHFLSKPIEKNNFIDLISSLLIKK